ncbi:MAG: winged helix-turn-helix transcriptional regulator [FCB group bacterium]|nr:winged helix-turn-helix transcriptional regulator [FCB group bacterium]
MDPKTQNALRIVKDLLSLNAHLRRVGNRITGKYGLKQQQFVVLSEIVMKGEINQKQIAGELLYEKSNVSKIVKKLKALGLIEITQSSADRRITLLRPTDSGRKIQAKCMKQLNAWNRDWINPLTDDEIRQTIQVLAHLKELS